MNDTTSRSLVLALGLILLTSACTSAPKESPEDQIRALIAKGEKAAEEKDLGTLKDLLSDTYQDEQGNKKPEIMKILAFHLMRNASVHLLTRVRTIELPAPTNAKATVYVGMAGGKLESLDDLLRYRADLYRVDFTATAEAPKQWKVTSAKWRPAEMSDFE